MSEPPPILSLRDVSKSFGAVRALQNVRLDLWPGEVHGLVGENGAGKSTLVKILAGAHQADTGTLTVDGKELRLTGPGDAQAAGIAVIYQEPTLFPDLSVAENIFMSRQPLRSLRRIDARAMRAATAELFARLGIQLDPDRPARGLSIADQQLVEIAKALAFDARILIMDEPTAALSGVEVERLFSVVASLREAGAAVLFISHRFDEIFALCRRVTVMRDGRWVSTGPASELTVEELVRRMVGREVSSLYPKTATAPGEARLEARLEVRGLTRHGAFTGVSFTLHAGEIVALAGLVGAGRSEVARAVFGVDRYDEGEVLAGGKPLPKGDTAAAIAAGLALVPEDRRQQGLVMELSVERNATLTRRWSLSRLGLLLGGGERAAAREWSERLRVKTARLTDPVSTLSGGNQQKVVLAKWLSTQPRVLIVDEPTRGIDVGTKAEVHRLLSELAGQGVAVLMISSELPEVLGMADRVLVMHEGRLAAEIPRARADEESVMLAATGQRGVV
ncbi:Predicted L-rhamnose ABC transporter, ATP-binding component [[Actinomadura] parvosata subsp. kistnae]|uniref:D-xylose ABC transporter ATP-binding protein n=1 Tax=[Actinomadura] parvosata subsp. kistnae TaxID=1909395 RepID=A0A1V0A2D6_9ACTN|nr:sugar ABC transporter ATP-binding protein [Nonomuraea sp. ATCC 55076]AQZ64347.1 D-xylose ABC transporter ATP-binding protein [Nonomuraea sp. ATCC 55076]SPL89120.1 Predicted L-rhamnose ABC transporter, ATP-binding component [Actinomadura parvosata subsp. kistnae]